MSSAAPRAVYYALASNVADQIENDLKSAFPTARWIFFEPELREHGSHLPQKRLERAFEW
ncbi:hypothetical protein PQQ52_32755 [Paraburkholderia sediminicola]|uniref:hypothetical protein n=1 Tax=Paraburkholderia sediminicola TaxID=458836 RepID=UPI0038BD5C41